MFTWPLTDREEYWIGYLRADGSMSRKPGGKIVVFCQKHREPVDCYAGFIGAKREVTFYTQETRHGTGEMYRIASANYSARLDEIGVKTDLDPRLYMSRHFWRGLLDGDGTLGMFINGGRPYPAISWCGFKADMEALSVWVADTLQTTRPKVSSTSCEYLYRVGLGGRKAKYLAQIMYVGQYACLSYKRQAAETMAAWQPKTNRRIGFKLEFTDI